VMSSPPPAASISPAPPPPPRTLLPTRRSSDLPARRPGRRARRGLHRAGDRSSRQRRRRRPPGGELQPVLARSPVREGQRHPHPQDRKSTRLNSSHVSISYAVFCLKKKIKTNNNQYTRNDQ